MFIWLLICQKSLLIAIDLSRQKELDADSKAIQQMGFIGQLKKLDNTNTNDESMFTLTILENIKETRKKIIRKCKSILNDSKSSKSKSQVNKDTIK